MIAQLAQDPTIQAIVGLVATAITGGVGWIASRFLGMRAARAKRAEAKADAAIKALAKFETEVAKTFGQVTATLKAHETVLIERLATITGQQNEKLAELKGVVQNLASDVRHYAANVSKLEGRVDDQVHASASYNTAIGHMTRQLDRLFDIVTGKSEPYEKKSKQG